MFNILKFILWIYYKMFFKVVIINKEKLEQAKGVVISGNHLSNHDSIIFFPFFKNKIRFIAKEEIFKVPLLRNLVKLVDAIPVNRGTFDKSCINEAIKTLKEGKNIGLFPEGTRSKSKELKLGKPHKGVSLISTRARANVLTFAIIPKNNFRIFSEIKIIIGEEINTSVLKDKGYNHDQITEVIMNSIEKIIESEK